MNKTHNILTLAHRDSITKFERGTIKMASKKRAATLKDIAREAGVSPMTVSTFINDKFQFMSAPTRQRVAAAVADLNYRPDTAGRREPTQRRSWRSIWPSRSSTVSVRPK